MVIEFFFVWIKEIMEFRCYMEIVFMMDEIDLSIKVFIYVGMVLGYVEVMF